MKVLVPLDGSEVSHEAMCKGLELIQGCRPEVTLFCIRAGGFDGADDDRKEMFEADPDDEIFASEEEAHAMLDAALESCSGLDVTAKKKVVVGSHPKIIQEESSQHDLLLMHRLSKESIKEKIRMSQAESIVRNAACAVMLV